MNHLKNRKWYNFRIAPLTFAGLWTPPSMFGLFSTKFVSGVIWQIMTKQRISVVTAELIVYAFRTNWLNELVCVIFPRSPSRFEWTECFFACGVVVVVGTPPSTSICLFIISSFWLRWNVQQKNWFCFFKILASVFPVGVFISLVNVIAVINLGYEIRKKRMNRQNTNDEK